MKKKLLYLFILFITSGTSFAQTVVFWTDNVDALPIKVYMNGSYIGSITKAYRSVPDCYTSGCVTKQPPYKSNTWRAVSESLGAETTGKYSLVNGCNSFQLFSGDRKIDHNPYQNSTSNNDNSGSSSSNNGDYGGAGSALAGLGIVVAGLAVVAGEVILNSDLYVSGIAADYYSGLEFGFRNNWNNHISFEQTVAWRYSLEEPLFPPFHTDTYGNNPFLGDYDYRKRSNWGCNFRLLYNFMDRGRVFSRNHKFMLNPYIGFGCDYMQYDGFFTSAVAGFTFGNYWVKMDCRYTFGYDFRNQRIPVNQIQLGLIVTYQFYKFGFFN